MKGKYFSLQNGQLLVELLVTIGLIAIIIPGLVDGIFATRGGRAQQDKRQQAISLVKEGQEATRVFREADWTSFAVNGTYYPKVAGNTWTLTIPPPEAITGGFSRTITINDVYRNSSGNIVAATDPGATIDSSTKQVVTTVSWNSPIPSSVKATDYLTRFGNTTFSESGTIQPPAGFGDWCNPTLLAQTKVDLIRQGFPTTIWAFPTSTGTNYRVFTGTGHNASGPTFSNIDITGNPPPTNPPVNDWNENGIKANSVFGDEHYAYLATDSKGLIILDLNSFPYQKKGSFNPGGMKPANSVYIVNNVDNTATGYLVTDNKFYILNISADRQTITQTGVIDLANGAKVVVDNAKQYAYVANPDSNQELKIIDVHSNPANPTIVGWANVSGGAGKDIYVSGNTAYLLTANSGSPEFFVINLSPTRVGSQSVASSYDTTTDTGGMQPTGIAVVSPTRAIIVGTGGSIQYDVIDMSLSPMAKCNPPGLAITGGVNGISSLLQSNGHAYSYIVTNDSSAELQIIEGGSGGGGGGTGIFESSTFDAGHDVAFNYFSTPTSDPNLSYEISIKHGATGGSCGVGITCCKDVSFGPGDFTPNPFVPPTALPFRTTVGYTNPGQCLQYRVTNHGSTALSYTVTINYSP